MKGIFNVVCNKEVCSLQVKYWFFSIFFRPKQWALDYHRKAECCKFWLLVGPFEINRVWSDEDEYPFTFPEDEL